MDYKHLEDDELYLKLVLKLRNDYYYQIHRKSDDARVGNIGLRTEKNYQNEFLGNIEYEILNDFQGNNYALKATRLIGKLACDLGLTELLLTCRPDNFPSIKTIEKLPAGFLDIVKVPKDTVLYKQGDRKLNRYIWDLKKEGEKNDRHKIN